jgi:hypothetical protein
MQIPRRLHPKVPQTVSLRADRKDGARCFATWRSAGNASSKNGISCAITCICSSQFRRSISVANVVGFVPMQEFDMDCPEYRMEWLGISPEPSSGRGDILFRPVGRDEETIRLYIRNQELQDKELDQPSPFRLTYPSHNLHLKLLLAAPNHPPAWLGVIDCQFAAMLLWLK